MNWKVFALVALVLMAAGVFAVSGSVGANVLVLPTPTPSPISPPGDGGGGGGCVGAGCSTPTPNPTVTIIPAVTPTPVATPREENVRMPVVEPKKPPVQATPSVEIPQPVPSAPAPVTGLFSASQIPFLGFLLLALVAAYFFYSTGKIKGGKTHRVNYGIAALVALVLPLGVIVFFNWSEIALVLVVLEDAGAYWGWRQARMAVKAR